MSTQTVTRTARGLWSQFNPINEIPEGGLLEAKNVVIDREGVISKARGFDRYGTELAGRGEAFLEYVDKLILNQGTNLRYDIDGSGSFTSYTGSFSPPDSTCRIRGLELRGSLYLTTSEGIKKTSNISTAPAAAGIPPGLDLDLTLTGVGGGWFPPGTTVAHRLLWGRIDEQDQLLLGEPSFRETVSNPMTAVTWSRVGTVCTVTHPAHGYSTGDIVEVSLSSDSIVVPNGPEVITVTGANTYTFVCLDVTTSATWTRGEGSPNTITVTQTGHTYANNISVAVTESSDTTAVPNATYTIVRPTGNGYAFSAGGTGATTGTLKAASLTGTLSAGKKFNVSVTFTIPDGVQADDFYELYRTQVSPEGATDPEPGDQHLKVVRRMVSVAELAAKTLTVLDDQDPAFLGDQLYTNSTREGIKQANSRPPWAKDIALFKQTTFAANIQRQEFIELQLLTTNGIINGTDYIRFTMGASIYTYTAAATENVENRQWKNFAADTVLTQSQKVERTIRSFIRVLNRDASNTLLYAFYISGIEDAPGKIVIERRTFNTGTFFLTVNNSTFAAKWTPTLPVTGQSLGSDNGRAKNGLARSKLDQPEAFPEENFDPIGSEKYDIVRILALRDSLIILKEEGAWRLSGSPARAGRLFEVQELDSTVRILAPETACVVDNAVWCLATQGIVRITESGTEIVSRQIETDLQKLYQRADITRCHAVGYEANNEYIFWAPEFINGLGYMTGYRYNYYTQAWTELEKRARAAHVLFRRKKLYLADDEDNWIVEERKSLSVLNGDDFLDESLTTEFTVTAVNLVTDSLGAQVTQVDTSTSSLYVPLEGWQFEQGGPDAWITVVESIAGGYRLTLSKYEVSFVTGACTITKSIASRVRWAPEDCDAVSLLKHFSEVQVYVKDRFSLPRYTLAFRSDVNQIEAAARTIIGISPTNTLGRVLRVAPISTDYAKCRALDLIFEHRYAGQDFDILNVAYLWRNAGARTALVA